MARQKADPKNPNRKTWTMSALRRASYRWPPRSTAIANARVARGTYRCAMCGNETLKKGDFAVDHTIPIVPLQGWDSWDNVIERLLCSDTEFQILCKKPCHDTKTEIEDSMRESFKKENKEKEKKEDVREN